MRSIKNAYVTCLVAFTVIPCLILVGTVYFLSLSTIKNEYTSILTNVESSETSQILIQEKTEEEMKQQSTYAGFDFENIWKISL